MSNELTDADHESFEKFRALRGMLKRSKPIVGTLEASDEMIGDLKAAMTCPLCQGTTPEQLLDLAASSLTDGIDVTDLSREERRTLRRSDEQRLQQLREDFEEARNEHRKALRSRYTGTLYRDLCSYSTCGTVEDMANSADFDNYTQDVQKMIQAARRYIIARDFNVFDPERADMLWKLQNGGAQ